jgi:hypothetical protein
MNKFEDKSHEKIVLSIVKDLDISLIKSGEKYSKHIKGNILSDLLANALVNFFCSSTACLLASESPKNRNNLIKQIKDNISYILNKHLKHLDEEKEKKH